MEKKKTSKGIIIGIVIAVVIAIIVIVCLALGKNKDEEVYRVVKVNSFSGDIELDRKSDGTSPEIFEGFQLITEDQVNVNEDSLIELLLDTDKHIVAESNTSFILNASGTEEEGSIKIDLLYGESLFTIDNKLPEASTFEVTTPNVSLSVRGTKFTVIYDPDKEETTVEVFDGVVVVVSNGEEYVMEAGDKRVFGNGDDVLESDETDDETDDEIDDETDNETDNETDIEESADVENVEEDTADNEEENVEEAAEEELEAVVEEAKLTEATLKGDWMFYHFEDPDGITDNIMVFNGDGTGWYVTRIWAPSYETGEMTDMTWANPIVYSINGDVVNIKEDWGSRVDEYSIKVTDISANKMVATGDGALGGEKAYTKIFDLGRSWVR